MNRLLPRDVSAQTHVTNPGVFLNFFCLQDSARREAIKTGAAAVVGAAFLPAAANAAVGESPRFSVFGLVGDGTSYSEGAAYGSDQKGTTYSPYSVYGNVGGDSLYKEGASEYSDRKKSILTETRKRLQNLPAYVDKKQWFNVSDELARFMYETRGAARGLADSPEQKKAATAFFKAIETTDLAARRKNQDACAAAAADTIVTLDAFVATL